MLFSETENVQNRYNLFPLNYITKQERLLSSFLTIEYSKPLIVPYLIL